MIIEQTLHGYNKGHGLLASSFPMRPTDDSSLMSILSDWTGFRAESGEDSYMTFYPLEQGKKYAFAKTWYAPEMERPGCVWTHTLILDLENLDRNFDFRVLKEFFHRPLIDRYEEYSRKIEIKEFPKENSKTVFAHFDGVAILFLLLFLLCGNDKLTIYMEQEQESYADLCYYLLQYLPIERLKKVALSTGSKSYRKVGDKDFTIQFTNNPICLSLTDAPWRERLNVDSFDEGLRYIYTESQKDNDQLPSLIRLFSNDISDQKDKYYAFAMLMKNLDLSIHETKQVEYAEVLHLLKTYFPNNNEGELLKYNFLSEKISNKFGKEEDILYQISALDSSDFLNQGYVKYGSRIISLDKEKHSDFIVLIDNIAKLKKYNTFAVEALEYSIDTLEEKDLLGLILDNWENIYALLEDNEHFLSSGMWLKLPTNQFNILLSLYINKDFSQFTLWEALLNKILMSESSINESFATKIIDKVENAISIILNTANSDSFIAPSLMQVSLSHINDILEWIENQDSINKRIENFILNSINPVSAEVKQYHSMTWKVLRSIDDNTKSIEYYIYLYILAHNWKDEMSILLLKQSFLHIYIELSQNTLDDKLWSTIKGYTPQNKKIAKWDKCKILSYGLIVYLKECDYSIEKLSQFTTSIEVNKRLIHLWGKSSRKEE